MVLSENLVSGTLQWRQKLIERLEIATEWTRWEALDRREQMLSEVEFSEKR